MSKRRGAAPEEEQQREHHCRHPKFLLGLRQAPRLDLAVAAVSRSETARAAALQCFCFNGIIFVSLLAWRWAVAPAAAAAAAAAPSLSFPPLLSSLAAALFAPRAEDPSSLEPPLELTAAFILGWVFPASATALSLSGPWCLAVAKGVFNEEGGRLRESRRGRTSGGSGGGGRSRSRSSRARTAANGGSSSRGGANSFSPPPPTKSTRKKAAVASSSSASSSSAAAAEAEALELYRGTLFSFLWAQAGLSRLVPFPRPLSFLGPLLSTLLTWLLYGLMAFDYRFTAESSENSKNKSAAVVIGVADRLAAFGKDWPFYLAFGIVAASPSLVLPFWEGMAAVAAIYPLFVALAASGKAAAPTEDGFPRVPSSTTTASSRISLLSFVFGPAILVTDLVVSVLIPLGWKVVGRAARLLGLSSGGGEGQRGRGRRR